MISPDELTTDVVAFLMTAVLEGRVTRADACRLVAPWVEGVLVAEPLAEHGAQTLHGLDVVRRDGLHFHASCGIDGSFLLTDEEVLGRCREWLELARERSVAGRSAGDAADGADGVPGVDVGADDAGGAE